MYSDKSTEEAEEAVAPSTPEEAETVEQPATEEAVEPSTPEELAKQLTFEEFLSEVKLHMGLVASFKVENAEELGPRSQTAWEEAFESQSKKVYK